MDYYSTLDVTIIACCYAAIVGLSVWYGLKRLRGGINQLALRPDGIFFLMFGIIHGLMPILKLAVAYERYQLYYTVETHVLSFAYVLTYAASVAIAAIIVGQRPTPHPQLHGNIRVQLAVLVLVLGVPGVYGAFQIHSSVAAIGLDQFLTDRIGRGVELRRFSLFANALAVIPAAGLLWLLARGRKLGVVGWAAVMTILGVSVWLVSGAGNRNTAFYMLLTLLLTWSLTVVRLRASAAALGMIAVVAAGILLALAGEYRKELRAGSTYDLEFSVRTVVQGMNGALGGHENVLWLIEHEHYETQWGGTYTAGFLNLIPRSVWPDKPWGAGPILRNMVTPGHYEEWRAGRTSYTSGVVAEAMMNFRWVGLIVIGLLHGALMVFAGQWISRARSVHGLVLGAYLAVALSITIVYSEFLAWFGRNFMVAMMVLASAGIYYLLFTRRVTTATAIPRYRPQSGAAG